MSYRQSVGVDTQEIDNTLITSPVSTRASAFVGVYNWGPVEYPTTVINEQNLVSLFGTPTDLTAQTFYTAANYLAYTNNLLNVRIDAAGQHNAVQNHKTVLSGTVSIATNSTTVTGGLTGLNTTHFTTELAIGDKLVLINPNADEYTTIGTVETIDSANTIHLTTQYSGVALTDATIYIDKRITINNEDAYNTNFIDGATDVGQFAAKYPGKIGNSLQIIVLDHATFQKFNGTGTISGSPASATITLAGLTDTSYLQPGFILYDNSPSPSLTTGQQIGVIKRVNSNTSVTLVSPPTYTITNSAYTASIPAEFSSLFSRAPGTSNYAHSKGYEDALDELHIIVVDKDGLITGTKNAVLEKYSFLSKLQDAKGETGTTIYYKNVINTQSKWVWWLDLPSSTEVNSTGTPWGIDLTSQPPTAVLQTLKYPNFVNLNGGFNAKEYPTPLERDSDKIKTIQMLSNKELYTFQAIFLGQATSEVASAAIAMCELRKDAVTFISPEHTDGTPIVGTGTAAVNKILNYRSNLPSSSYAFLDSGYKEQLNKYSTKKIQVPLNGDIAGLNAAATEKEPWATPAGFTYGQLKNTVKLLFNPTEQDRDALYPKGVNPVVHFKSQGVVLYGDKTLLDKPSAFDRLETRNLFIFLEKTIEKFAQNTLFEINDAFTRSQFKNALDPFLRNIKGQRGIYDFLVVCDESNNNPSIVETNTFVADIKIKPQYRVNYINLNFVGTRQSASFTTTI
jgi:hypothetical protein